MHPGVYCRHFRSWRVEASSRRSRQKLGVCSCPATRERSMHRGVQKSRRAFTLVELLVVIGIIAVLIGILLPVLGRARDQANTTACMATLRSLGQTLAIYTSENKGSYPFSYYTDTAAAG